MRAISLLKMWPGISNCELAQSGHDLHVEFDEQVLRHEDVVLAAEAALRVARDCDRRATAGSDQASPATDDLSTSASWDMLIAGGSFVLGAAGLVLPGIPSVPFLVLGCHSLVRAYPQLQPWLDSIPAVGQLLSAPSANENKWTDPNFVAKTLILGALVAAFFLIVHPPLPLVLACEVGMMLFSIH